MPEPFVKGLFLLVLTQQLSECLAELLGALS